MSKSQLYSNSKSLNYKKGGMRSHSIGTQTIEYLPNIDKECEEALNFISKEFSKRERSKKWRRDHLPIDHFNKSIKIRKGQMLSTFENTKEKNFILINLATDKPGKNIKSMTASQASQANIKMEPLGFTWRYKSY